MSEKRLAQKYKAKPSIHDIGLKLAGKLYPMAEVTVDDVIERLFIEKAFHLDLLSEEAKANVPEEIKRPISIINGKPTAQTVGYMQAVSKPSLLPLGEVEEKRG